MMRLRLAILTAAALGVAACGGGGGGKSYSTPTSPGTPSTPSTPTVPANTIQATDGLAFNPTTLTVTRGTTVTFTFATVAHTVVFSGTGAPTNVAESSNTSAQRTFANAGVFGFTCSIHGGYMTGQITVQ